MHTVYTDEACAENGQDSARASIEVSGEDENQRNVSIAISPENPQTNGYAESAAVIRAIKTAFLFKFG